MTGTAQTPPEPSWPRFTCEIEQDGDARIIRWRDADGYLQDLPDGTAAVRWFYPNGTVEEEGHWQASHLQDPPDGTPAKRWYYPDGRVKGEAHWQAYRLQDPPDGSPAVRRFYLDGSVKGETHHPAP